MASYSLVSSRLGTDLARVYCEYLIPDLDMIRGIWKSVLTQLTLGVTEMHPELPHAVREPEDQTRLARELMAKGIDHPMYKILPHYGGFGGMFHHVDNVRFHFNYWYNETPAWFRAKYDRHLRMEQINEQET